MDPEDDVADSPALESVTNKPSILGEIDESSMEATPLKQLPTEEVKEGPATPPAMPQMAEAPNSVATVVANCQMGQESELVQLDDKNKIVSIKKFLTTKTGKI